MKKYVVVFLLLTGVIVSCKKYEEGPAFSFRTVKARLTGDWKYDKIYHNDEDITATISTVPGVRFAKDAKYYVLNSAKEPDASSSDGEDTWELIYDKEKLRITNHYTLLGTPQVYEVTEDIIRLTNCQLWLKSTDANGDVYETHLECWR
jgi:hypothetical protein